MCSMRHIVEDAVYDWLDDVAEHVIEDVAYNM
jgi:hypothetical protein